MKLLWWRGVVPLRLRSLGVLVGPSTSFIGMPIVSKAPESTIEIGERCSIISAASETALGVNHSVIIRALRPRAQITIGDDVGISGAVICAAISVQIGERCLIGANVTIFDTDFHSLAALNRRYNKNPQDIRACPVRIGNNVFIGTGSIITKGVSVGDNSIIGAGSVVVNDVPANVVAAGNPARVIREIPC